MVYLPGFLIMLAYNIIGLSLFAGLAYWIYRLEKKEADAPVEILKTRIRELKSELKRLMREYDTYSGAILREQERFIFNEHNEALGVAAFPENEKEEMRRAIGIYRERARAANDRVREICDELAVLRRHLPPDVAE